MTKLDAKRHACREVSRLIDSTLGSGWDTSILFPIQKDEDRFLGALQELEDELYRRGKRAPQTQHDLESVL